LQLQQLQRLLPAHRLLGDRVQQGGQALLRMAAAAGHRNSYHSTYSAAASSSSSTTATATIAGKCKLITTTHTN